MIHMIWGHTTSFKFANSLLNHLPRWRRFTLTFITSLFRLHGVFPNRKQCSISYRQKDCALWERYENLFCGVISVSSYGLIELPSMLYSSLIIILFLIFVQNHIQISTSLRTRLLYLCVFKDIICSKFNRCLQSV